MPKQKLTDSRAKQSVNKEVKKTAKGFKFPEHISSGFIIKDTKKREWQIQSTIGTGGFGEIYSASEVGQASTSKDDFYPYAVKVEPKENGPLYVEMHFYMRVAKAEEIEQWKKERKLNNFGMPVLHGSGSFEYKSCSYRFLVTDRLDKDLQSILNENNKQLPPVTVMQIGVQVLNVLEYIHSKGYIHGDIKAANMMLGLMPGTENTVYMIDFGLAAKCPSSTKEFTKDPKKVNNGTIEYISRDGHSGVFGFRGDLEILGYNLLHWLNGSLPWENKIANVAVVEQKKNELMSNVQDYIKKYMPQVPEEVTKYLDYISSLKNNDIPDYDYCRKLFTKKLSQLNCSSPYEKLLFSSDKTGNNSPSRSLKKGKRKSIRPVVVAKKVTIKTAKKRKSLKSDSCENGEQQPSPKKIKERKLNNCVPNESEEVLSADEGNSVKKGDSKENVVSVNKNSIIKSNSRALKNKTVNSNVSKKTAAKKDVTQNEKPSWKNAQTVIASNVKVPGEYTKIGKAVKKKK
ncbi:serine/threonine-protein kinase VRK1-like [Lycorma delicatula]|uniref:serine/threonine-protein kinase VRK1-like n=1 Tax=Lycorma delicatula TaxID=130591 RepID=UPI003F50FC8F